MGRNVAQADRGASGGRGDDAGHEIALRVDQTLTQDATGTLVMLELEALGLKRVRTEVSVQYVDHNLLQTDERNMADHLFLRSAAQRFGLWFSPPGGGRVAPGAHAALRDPRQVVDRLGLPYLRRRLAGHAGHRRRRPGGRAGDGGGAAVPDDAQGLGCAADRGTPRLGQREGRGAGDAAPPRSQGRGAPDHRVPRARVWRPCRRWTGTSSPTWAPSSERPRRCSPPTTGCANSFAQKAARTTSCSTRGRPGRRLRPH